MNRISNLVVSTVVAALFAFAGSVRAEESEVNIWNKILKDTYFKDVEVIEDKTVIEMQTPYRAEDAALTPVTITAKIPQKLDLYIEKIYVLVDKNPQPLVGVFHLTPEMGKADLALRIRINQYTDIRAIAVLNTGETHMVSNYIKASGGCSEPLGADMKEAMARMGQMKFRTVGETLQDATVVGQFNVSHPNFTGMSVDQRSGLTVPAYYINKLTLSYNNKVIMMAETGISVSADPSYRFFFKPAQGGKFKAEVEDSKGNRYSHEFEVAPGRES